MADVQDATGSYDGDGVWHPKDLQGQTPGQRGAFGDREPPVGTPEPTPPISPGYTTPQSATVGQGLGAYDAYAQQAFGGPTEAEQGVADQFAAVGSGQGPYGQQTNQMMKDAAAKAAGGGGVAGQDLGNVWGAAGSQFRGTNSAAVPENAQREAYMSMLNGGGYDAATKAAIANEGNASLNAQEEGVRDQLNNAAARTGSPFGAYGAIVDTNHQIGANRAGLARQNQILFANEEQRRKEAGASGLGQNAGLALNRENAGLSTALASNRQQNDQGLTASQQQNQFINDDTSRRLAGLNASAQQNQAQRGYQLAGAGGLNSILQGQMGQQTQLASILANILGTKQGDTTQLGENGGSIQLGL